MSMRFHFDRQTPVTAATLALYVAAAIATLGAQALNPSSEALDRFGAAIGFRIANGELWRLVSHAYLHGGIIHLAFNGMALWSIGPQLERLLGSLRFFVLYIVSAIAGCIVGMLVHSPVVPLVGGSGALFGMMGAMVAMNTRHGRSPLDFLEYEGPRQLISMIVANLILGFLIPNVSNAAHVGGLVGGFALVHQFFDRRGRHAPDRLGVVVQSGWIAVFVAGVVWVAYPVTRWDYWWGKYLSEGNAHSDPQIVDAIDLRRVEPIDLAYLQQLMRSRKR